MSYPAAVPFFVPGFRLPKGDDLQALSDMLGSSQGDTGNTITAFAGGGQANATLINAANVYVGTVATAGDSIKLPPTFAGQRVAVINGASNPMQVFGSGADTINGVATATGISQPANSIEIYICATAGKWFVDAGVGFSGSLFTESAKDNITAFATGGQTSATQLTTQTSRITTVATAGDSIKLPASAPGLELMVINSGANPMQVFGAGADTIDGVATATGVSQMTNSVVIYVCTTAGAWYTEGLATGYAGGGLQTLSFSSALTAFAGGGQASATALPSLINRVSTVVNQGDSVKLPGAIAGLAIVVLNRGAQPMQVFGAGTDTINGIATATGISQGINTTATYVCAVAGNWEVPITALQSTTPSALSVNGAIPSHVGHTYVVTKAGVLADTLAAPTATTDDGIEITVTSNTANAHTITATGLLQTGTASVNVATFAAFAGAGLTLMAYQGKWNVVASVGITFS